ncbi:hypothetical protein BOTBODRAFT_124185 [Botryobasidium botryosum FD-172 SS1]|uniref:Breast carcinoma amplified sequence 2 n=1 Tax=Botryobasidium botryosum (strain FD-172 SS1) TaxID=930990 RepID=A0A067MXQ8_BOTB1|nr:hypothetical protein BOTBODRAFT_124185 [Botryobasidium botryosum FD-172 SS1]
MSSEESAVLHDSLPYYDRDLELHPSLRALVDAEIARELKRLPPPSLDDPRIPPDVELFANNPLLAAELVRVQSNQPLSALDSSRYQLPGPLGEGPTEADWKAAVQNAKAQLQHQQSRETNLSLLQTYGANAWKIHNYLLESEATRLDKALEELKEQVTTVNRDRKNFQTHVGKQLTAMETRWTELISTVLQIELANIFLEGQVEQLRLRELSME